MRANAIKLVGRDIMSRNASGKTVSRFQSVAGHGEPSAKLAVKARQKPAAADIRHKGNACFRHGKNGVLGSDTKSAVNGNPDTAAHRHTIHHRKYGLWIGFEQMIQLIFEAEKGAGFRAVALSTL